MRKKKRGNRKKIVTDAKLNYIAIGLMIATLFSFFSWGFVGAFLSNLIRLVVGNAYHLFSVILFIYSGYFLYQKTMKLPFSRKQVVAIGITLISLLIIFEVLSFPSEKQLIAKTWSALASDLFANQVAADVGGGLIGAAFAQIFLFLFGEIGMYVILSLSCFTVIFLLSGLTIQEVTHAFQQKASQAKQDAQQKRAVSKEPKEKYSPLQNLKQGFNQIVEEFRQPDSNTEEITENDNDDGLYPNKPEPLIINAFTPGVDDSVETIKTVPTQDMASVEEIEQEEKISVTFSQNEENENYILPPVSLLNKIESVDQSDEYHLIKKNSKLLEDTFKSFGVNARVISANLGPSVTKFEIQPAVGVKVSKIVSLADDIALALAAKDIRIEAPIPGKSYIGIEVPNQTVSMVSFREIIENNIHSKSKLEVPLGRDISGNIKIADLSKMPHLLVAGATGSGKSVAINGMITSILMKAKPNEVKLMMIDPKKVELNVYNGIPHLLTPVVTNPRRAAQALQKVVAEMERRYELFAQTGMRNISGYNEQVEESDDDTLQKMPYIVVIVDELADLMMVASNEVEAAIIRLAQMARAAGIHMVLATQRPSVDVITGLIKANVPSRMAFAVSSSIDSRTIIDSNGAEKLLGRGDMLFMPMGENKPIRVQGAFLSDQEVEKIVDFVKTQQAASYVEEMMPSDNDNVASGQSESEDELFTDVVEFLQSQEFISVSMLQRRFRIGFNRAARLMDDLEAKGYVAAAEGTKPRRVLLGESEQES